MFNPVQCTGSVVLKDACRALKHMDANSSAWMRTLTHGRALTVLTGVID